MKHGPTKNPLGTVIWIIVIASPYIIAFGPPPVDSLNTTIDVAVGTGSYNNVARDCQGHVVSVSPQRFNEVGMGVSHTFSDVKVGVRAGVTTANRNGELAMANKDTDPVMYVNPTLGFHFRGIGGDMGLFVPLNERNGETESPGSSDDGGLRPTVDLRFGRLDRLHMTIGYASNLPLVSRGGLVDLGVGIPLGPPRSRLWLGLGFYPWDSGAFVARADLPVLDQFDLRLGTLIGWAPAPLEYGIFLGGGIRFLSTRDGKAFNRESNSPCDNPVLRCAVCNCDGAEGNRRNSWARCWSPSNQCKYRSNDEFRSGEKAGSKRGPPLVG